VSSQQSVAPVVEQDVVGFPESERERSASMTQAARVDAQVAVQLLLQSSPRLVLLARRIIASNRHPRLHHRENALPPAPDEFGVSVGDVDGRSRIVERLASNDSAPDLGEAELKIADVEFSILVAFLLLLLEETDRAVDVALVGVEDDDAKAFGSGVGLGFLVGELAHAVGDSGVRARNAEEESFGPLVVRRSAEEVALVLDEEEIAETVAESAEVLDEHTILLGELVVFDVFLVGETKGEKASDAVLVSVDRERGGRTGALDAGERARISAGKVKGEPEPLTELYEAPTPP